jgi:hypothetical protein
LPDRGTDPYRDETWQRRLPAEAAGVWRARFNTLLAFSLILAMPIQTREKPKVKILIRFRPKPIALILGVMALSSATFAAGIDSRAYTCANLQAVIAAQRFVFISQPAFGDFVVSNAYYCSGGSTTQTRSVPTTDNPECPVNYCVGRNSGGD